MRSVGMLRSNPAHGSRGQEDTGPWSIHVSKTRTLCLAHTQAPGQGNTAHFLCVRRMLWDLPPRHSFPLKQAGPKRTLPPRKGRGGDRLFLLCIKIPDLLRAQYAQPLRVGTRRAGDAAAHLIAQASVTVWARSSKAVSESWLCIRITWQLCVIVNARTLPQRLT